MFEYVPTEYARIFFIVCLIALAVIALVCLVRAILGPKFTDRIMAVNMIGTKTLLMVCVLAVLLQESYLVDVAIVYALLSFLAVVVLSKLVITRYRVKKAGIFVFAAAAFGVFKFKYVLNRMHVAAKCDSLGALLILVGCMILGGFSFMTLKLLLVLLILWITSPVAAHLIVKAEVKTQDEDESDEYEVIGK